VKKFPKVHWETTKGNEEQNIKYCSKKEDGCGVSSPPAAGTPPPIEDHTNDVRWGEVASPASRIGLGGGLYSFEEYGSRAKQGFRSDLKQVADKIVNGASIEDLAKEHPLEYIKYHNGISKLKAVLEKGGNEQKEVIVKIGPSGCGKTRWAWDNYPDLYSKPAGPWWDGYDGQETVLLDDYDGHIQYAELLRILDRYPMKVPVKGAFVNLIAKRIIITSNDDIYKWYPMKTDLSALKRRISCLYNEHEICPIQQANWKTHSKSTETVIVLEDPMNLQK